MDYRTYLTCLWPGLSELWWRGRLSALPLAIGFAIGLNAWLVFRFVFPNWLDPFLVSAGFWIGLVGWATWTIKSIRELPQLLSPRASSEQPDRFPEAQRLYLQGKWSEAETVLLSVLAIEPRDPPALLMLSGVYRHTGRLDAASALVAELCRLEIAEMWQVEIRCEQSRIERDLQSAGESDDEVSAVEDAKIDDDSTSPPAADLTAA